MFQSWAVDPSVHITLKHVLVLQVTKSLKSLMPLIRAHSLPNFTSWHVSKLRYRAHATKLETSHTVH